MTKISQILTLSLNWIIFFLLFQSTTVSCEYLAQVLSGKTRHNRGEVTERRSVHFLRNLVQAVVAMDLEDEMLDNLVAKKRVERMMPDPDIVAMQPTKWGGGTGALCTPEDEIDCSKFTRGKSCHVKPSGGSCCVCVGDYNDKRRKRSLNEILNPN